jgi:hypothetical protein
VRSADFKIRVAVCALYSVAFISLIWWLGFAPEFTFLLVLLAFFPFLIAFLHLLVWPRQAFRRDPKFRDEYQLQFSDDGIQFRTPQIDALIQWDLYTKVIENERFYLLVYGRHMLSVIPKRAFQSAQQQEAFDQLLRRKLPACFDSKRLRARKPDEVEKPYVPPTEPPDWR